MLHRSCISEVFTSALKIPLQERNVGLETFAKSRMALCCQDYARL